MDNLKIFPIESGPVATLGYMVADTTQQKAVVVDVPLDSADFFVKTAQKEGLTIEAIWLTHSHWDHTGDAAKLHRATQAPVYVHRADEYRMIEPNNYTGFPLPFSLEPVHANRYVEHGDTLDCGDWSFEVRHTPGHTEGGVCFIDHKRNIALVGDTLFAGSVGRTDLHGGDMDVLLDSIASQLLTLPDDTLVLAGHGSATSIGTERASNPFLRR